MDVPATILKAAGVAHPETYEGKTVAPLQGKSLQPILDNSRRGGSRPVGLAGVGALWQSRHSRRTIGNCSGSANRSVPSEWQLYDLKTDPAEINDLAAEQPQVRDRLVDHWRAYAEKNNVIIPDRSPVCSDTAGTAPAH